MNVYEFLTQFAISWAGVREQTGRNDGPEIEMFQRAVDGVAQGEPYCMCFVQFCILQSEQQFGLQSPLFRSEHCLTVWTQSQSLTVWPPFPGCLAIWQHGTTSNGHVGIVTGVDSTSNHFRTVEGNTSGGAGIEREGDGVYEKLRSFAPEGPMRLLGFLDPFRIRQ